MRKLFIMIGNLLFIANYVLCSVIFIFFLNWYDTGSWSNDGWIFMASGGLVCGILALIIERRLHLKFGFWPHSRSLFFVRFIAFSILFIDLSFALGGFLEIFLAPAGYLLEDSVRKALAKLFAIPFVVLFYLPLIAPFGALVGAINGMLFQVAYRSSKFDEQV